MQPTRVHGTILTHLAREGPAKGALWLIKGSKGAGKTQWCTALATAARAADYTVAGVLSPGVIIGERKVAIDLQDAGSQTKRRLAALHAWPGVLPVAQILERGAGDLLPTAGRWRFDAATLAWGNGLLRAAAGADLVIVDEIGPLELRQGGGLQAALSLVDGARYRAACLTIRPSLLDEARERWPHGQIVVLDGGESLPWEAP